MIDRSGFTIIPTGQVQGSIPRAMRQLAAGNTGTEIPNAMRRDELGAMARAVEIFKQAAIENAVVGFAVATRTVGHVDMDDAKTLAPRFLGQRRGIVLPTQKFRANVHVHVDNALVADMRKRVHRVSPSALSPSQPFRAVRGAEACRRERDWVAVARKWLKMLSGASILLYKQNGNRLSRKWKKYGVVGAWQAAATEPG